MIFRPLTGFLRNHGRISKGALKRSSSTKSCEINSRGPPNLVVTLDPSNFAEKKQRRLRIGNMIHFRPYVALQNEPNPVRVPRLYYYFQATLWSPYPPDTRAFLYYFKSPEKPRIAGEIRLRVASSDDPASFESGSDLLKSNGQPWSRSLCSVSKHYIPLYQKLKEEGLVSHDLDVVVSSFTRVPRIHPIYTLNDTFIVDFSNRHLFLSVITEKGMEMVGLMLTFEEKRTKRVLPYTGRALARFERSTLPHHKGTRTVVLRFLKIITPVKCVVPHYDDYLVPPKEGELYRRSRKAVDMLNPPAWSANIDKRAALRGLQLLWDA